MQEKGQGVATKAELVTSLYRLLCVKHGTNANECTQADAGVKTKTQLVAERSVLVTLVAAVIGEHLCGCVCVCVRVCVCVCEYVCGCVKIF
jgi:hypothetical protein